MRARRPSAVLLVFSFGACTPADAAAQVYDHDRRTEPWVQDVGLAMANAFTGGVTSAVSAWLRGEDIGRAIVGGMVGGGVVFAGKRLVVEDFDGAGILGRYVGALGSNVVRNAGRGTGWVDEVWLPLGPLWIQSSPESDRGLRVNVWQSVVLGWALTRKELELDWSSSAWSGTLVFKAPRHRLRSDGDPIGGFAVGSLVFLGPGSESDIQLSRGHELVHVVQQDFGYLAWERPAESWGWSRAFHRSSPVDLGLLSSVLLQPIIRPLPEGEAGVLESR
jgi:hypothetical protein